MNFTLLARLAVTMLSAGAVATLVSNAHAGSTDSPRILLHARVATTKGTCSPGITSCADAQTAGFLQPQGGLFYYVYVLAARYGDSGVHEIHVGLSYNTTTVAGVDIFTWSLCADGEALGEGWYQAGGDNRITWASQGSDSLAVAGYFYVTAYDPSYLALIPPPGGDATLTPFSGTPVAIPAQHLGFIGFGSLEGCNPCLTSCDYTPVRPSTWSSLKLFFSSP